MTMPNPQDRIIALEEENARRDAHVQAASAVFRSCGFTLAAMQYKRPADALEALRRFNGVPAGVKTPFAWGYFPNAYMRDNWRSLYGEFHPTKQGEE